METCNKPLIKSRVENKFTHFKNFQGIVHLGGGNQSFELLLSVVHTEQNDSILPPDERDRWRPFTICSITPYL
jgi:hypothetical protein